MNKQFFKEYGATLLKSVMVGGTTLVPGVSGGSMMMILGIYDGVISAVSSFMADKKRNALLLLTFLVGSGLGMLLFANPLGILLELFPLVMMYFFMGAVAGGVPTIVRQTGVKKFEVKYLVYVAVGALVVLALGQIPVSSGFGDAGGLSALVGMLIAGLIIAIALVLPGISMSYMLLVLGLYEKTLGAISNLEFSFLIPLALGVGGGVLLTTKSLEYVMKQYPKVSYFVILGFVLGSIVEIFPGIPAGLDIPLCALSFVAGGGVIYLVGRLGGGD